MSEIFGGEGKTANLSFKLREVIKKKNWKKAVDRLAFFQFFFDDFPNHVGKPPKITG